MPSTEVKLVHDCRTCRTCQWFWGGIKPYGNFPVYDWNEDYPEAVRQQENTTEYVTKPSVVGRVVGQGQVDPGVMHGCRKAPIMTVGINPNMTGYFAATAGARWAYPNFSSDARYAYYYRHHSVYQESVDLDFVKKFIVPGTEAKAERPGWLIGTERGSDHRWLLITVRYQGDDENSQIEASWTETQHFSMLLDNVRKDYDTGEPILDPEKLSFQAGDTIGALVNIQAAEDVQLFENSTGYYQRFLYVLEKFRTLAGGPVATADFHLPDTVAQHDMIACASPGWSDKYDIPRERITDNCVKNHAWVISQIVQSRPKVLVVVGGSSLEMFAKVFGPFMDLDYLVQDGDGQPQVKEVFSLLKETSERKSYITISYGDYKLKTRIVISPHFSYSANFVQQSRFSDKAWAAFESDFPGEVEVLRKAGRVEENTYGDVQPIRLGHAKKDANGKRVLDSHGDPVYVAARDDDIQKSLSVAAWGVLMAYFYDPLEMMAEVLNQEFRAGELAVDATTKRLVRTEGACNFCVNSLWSFPEGCAYGKPEETQPREGYYEEVVEHILKIAQPDAGYTI